MYDVRLYGPVMVNVIETIEIDLFCYPVNYLQIKTQTHFHFMDACFYDEQLLFNLYLKSRRINGEINVCDSQFIMFYLVNP